MITELTVSNFRNIRHLTVKPLARLTLIGGKNGVGKTALLEALWLFTGPNRPDLTNRLDGFRGISERGRATFFANVFRNFDLDQSIRISAKESFHNGTSTLNITTEDNTIVTSPSDTPDGLNITERVGGKMVVFEYHDGQDGSRYRSSAWWFEQMIGPVVPVSGPIVSGGIQQSQARVPRRIGAIFVASRIRDDAGTVASRFGALQLSDQDSKITELLRYVEPRLKRLSPITLDGAPIIHAYLDSTPPMPVNLVGEGFARIFELSVALGSQPGGMLLIDEIENGLHHSALEKVFSNLMELAKEFDVQVVATTHSRECIMAAHTALGAQPEEDFAYHRIDRRGEKLVTFGYDAEMRETAIRHRMEIR